MHKKDLLFMWLGFIGLSFGLSFAAWRWLSIPPASRAKVYGIQAAQHPLKHSTWAALDLTSNGLHSSKREIMRILRQTLGIQLRWLPARFLPRSAYHSAYKRFRAERICQWLAENKPKWASLILGFTDVDISTSIHSFSDHAVFGLADRGGPAAIVSSYRLRLIADLTVRKRAFRALIVHESGHLRSLEHCSRSDCAMMDTQGSILRLKQMFPQLCSACLRQWNKKAR